MPVRPTAPNNETKEIEEVIPPNLLAALDAIAADAEAALVVASSPSRFHSTKSCQSNPLPL